MLQSRGKTIALALLLLVAILVGALLMTQRPARVSSEPAIERLPEALPEVAVATQPAQMRRDARTDQLTLVTENPAGDRRGDARVFRIVDGQCSLLGSTNEAGEMTVATSVFAGPASSVFAATADAISEEYPVAPGRSETLVLTLRPSASIEGVVTCEGAPVIGICVVATEIHAALGQQDALDRRQRRDPRNCAISASDGSFQIFGIVEGAPYLLIAGGTGFAAPGVRARGGDRHVEVVVVRVFATRLRFVTADGRPIVRPSCAGSVAYPMSTYKILADGAPSVIATQAALAGVPVEFLGRRSDDVVVLQRGPMGVDFIGPTLLGAHAVGYRSANPSIRLYPLDSGALHVEDLVFEPTATERGDLEIDLKIERAAELENNTPPNDSPLPLGTVFVLQRNSEHRDLGVEIPITSATSSPIHVASLPIGNYAVRFVSRSESIETKPISVAIDAAHVAHATIDVMADQPSAAGKIRLDPTTLDGRRVTCPLYVAMLRTDDAANMRRVFPKQAVFQVNAPYLIPLVSPGRYQLRVFRRDESDNKVLVEIDVRPNEIASAPLTLR